RNAGNCRMVTTMSIRAILGLALATAILGCRTPPFEFVAARDLGVDDPAVGAADLAVGAADLAVGAADLALGAADLPVGAADLAVRDLAPDLGARDLASPPDLAACFDVTGQAHNVAFVTSTVHTGQLGGLAGADAICQERASAAGLCGHFVA